MTLILPVNKVIFPATEKGKISEVKALAYKDVIGKQADYDVDAAKPFSFKTNFMPAFAQTGDDDRSFCNGLEMSYSEHIVIKQSVVDFLVDDDYIFRTEIYIDKIGTEDVFLYKTIKSTMLDETPTTTSVQIDSSIDIDYLDTYYNRVMTQDDNYVYIAYCFTSGSSDWEVVRVTKSDLTVLRSDAISQESSAGIASDTFKIMDIVVDDTFVYVCGYEIHDDGGDVYESWIAALKKDTLTTADTTVHYVTSSWKNFKALSLLRNRDLLVSGLNTTGTESSGLVYSFDYTAGFTLKSAVLESFDSDDASFISTDIDTDYEDSVYFSGEMGSQVIRKMTSCYGLLAGSSAVVTKTGYGVEFNSCHDFFFRTKFNYDGSGAAGGTVLQIYEGANVFSVSISAAYVIDITIGAVSVATAIPTALNTLYTAPQPFHTITLEIERSNSSIYVKCNGVDCTVTPTANVKEPIVSSDDLTVVLTQNLCYKEIYMEARSMISFPKTIMNFNFSDGLTDEMNAGWQFADTTLVPACFMLAEDSSETSPFVAYYAERLSVKKQYCYYKASGSAATINIERYDFNNNISTLSPNLDGSATAAGDDVIRVLAHDDDFVFLLTEMSYIADRTVFQISRGVFTDGPNIIYLLSSLSFSFACNAKYGYLRFSPTEAQIYNDDFIIDEDVAQEVELTGSAYNPEGDTVFTSGVIEFDDGHKDYVRFNFSSFDSVTIDTYKRAESGYAGTLYGYDPYECVFSESVVGKYKLDTKTLYRQDTASDFGSWLDTINIYYDWSQAHLLKDNPIEVYTVFGASAMKAEMYFALDTYYNFNEEVDIQTLSDDNDTGLLTNDAPAVSGRKDVEVIQNSGIDNRDARSIKFRIKASLDESDAYDSFKVYSIKYTPTGLFYISGDNDGQS